MTLFDRLKPEYKIILDETRNKYPKLTESLEESLKNKSNFMLLEYSEIFNLATLTEEYMSSVVGVCNYFNENKTIKNGK